MKRPAEHPPSPAASPGRPAGLSARLSALLGSGRPAKISTLGAPRAAGGTAAGTAGAHSGGPGPGPEGTALLTVTAPVPWPRRAWAMLRVFTSRRWLVFHVLVLAASTTMVLLGRWQLLVSNRRGFDWQNFGYWLQWWAFAAALLYMWLRSMYLTARPPAPAHVSTGLVLASRGQLTGLGGAGGLGGPAGPAELRAPDSEDGAGQQPVVYRGYVMPQSSQAPVRSYGDRLHDSYNDYLWQLSLGDGSSDQMRPRGGTPAQPADAQPPDTQPAAGQAPGQSGTASGLPAQQLPGGQLPSEDGQPR